MPDIKGVDVASWQGLPGQWSKDPGAQGIQWAAVKFTELRKDRLFENQDAKADWDWLWEHKLGRVAYLFAHPSVSVEATVTAFKAMADRLGIMPADGIAIDLEVTDGMSPAAVSSWARELAAALGALYGRRIIIYTFEDFIRQGNCHGLGQCLLWIASITTPGLPRIPGVWQDWFAQQWSQDGGIDRDVAHFSTLSAMQAAMGKAQYHVVEDVWVTAGMDSLVEWSHLVQTTIPEALRRTLLASANHQWEPALNEYLMTGDLNAKVPAGVHLRYLKRERV